MVVLTPTISNVPGEVRQQLVDRAPREGGQRRGLHTVAGEAGGGALGHDGAPLPAPPLRRAARPAPAPLPR